MDGASGNIARHVIDLLVKNDDIDMILFLRDAGNSDERQKEQQKQYRRLSLKVS
jgi:hypothetical protein